MKYSVFWALLDPAVAFAIDKYNEVFIFSV